MPEGVEPMTAEDADEILKKIADDLRVPGHLLVGVDSIDGEE